MHLSGSLSFVGLLLVACGTAPPSVVTDAGSLSGDTGASVDAGASSPDGGEPIDMALLCADAESYCEALYGCDPPFRVGQEGFEYDHTDVPTCITAMSARYQTQCRALAAAITEGRVTLDVAALTACRAAQAAASCEERIAPGPFDLCTSPPIAVGTVPNLGECRWDHDCAAEGDVCFSDLDGTDTGNCSLPGHEGGPCLGYLDRCEGGLACERFVCVAVAPPEG